MSRRSTWSPISASPTSRTDVLVYQTPVLQEDITIAGPISPKLFVSTSGTDSDFDVKLIDVYPADYGDNPRTRATKIAKSRGKMWTCRNSPWADTSNWFAASRSGENSATASKSRKPFTPGKVEEINFTMQDVNHTFRRGHRIMVQVQSSWFPLTDRNPQTFVNIPDAKPSDFVKATERVYHSAEQASGIGVQVIAAEETGNQNRVLVT